MRLITGEKEQAPPARTRPGERVVIVVGALVAGLAGAILAVTVTGGDDPDPVAAARPAATTTTTATTATTAAPAPVPEAPAPGGRTVPDPAEAALVAAIPQGRPVIDAENLQCHGPEPRPASSPDLPDDHWVWSSLHAVPLHELLTADLMVAACADGYWYPEDRPEPDAVACGRAGAPVPVVVALGGTTCADAGTGLRPLTAADVAEVNRLRAIEIGMLAVAEPCPTVEQAEVRVRQVLAEERLDLEVRRRDPMDAHPLRGVRHPDPEHEGHDDDPPAACPWRPKVAWSEGVVHVEAFHS